MKSLYHISSILFKDFLDSIKNRTVFFAIVFPVLLSIVFRIVLSPGNLPKLKIVIVSTGETQLVSFLRISSLGNIEVEKSDNLEKAKQMVVDGDAHGALILPKDFEQKAKSGQTPKVTFWMDGTNMAKTAALEIFLNRMLYLYVDRKPPVVVMLKNIRGENFNAGTAMLPTWLLFTILGAFMVVSSSIMEERERKTLQALLVTPVRLPQVLIGKGLLGFLLTVIGSLLILALNNGFVGNPAVSIALVMAGCAFFTFLGVFIGLLLPSQTTANAASSIIFMAMFLPVVIAETSKKMAVVAKLLPSYYINDGIKKAMFSGMGFDKMGGHIIYLLTASAIMLGLSVFTLNRKEDL